MAFADNLKQIPGVDDIEKLELLGEDGKVVATLENKPGKAGSLAVYNHLILRYRKINAAAAMEGLTLFAEHTNDAEQNPGKHPNIARLFKVIEEGLGYSATVTKINGNEETITRTPNYGAKTVKTESTKGWEKNESFNNLGLTTSSALTGTGVPAATLTPTWRAE